MPADYLKQMFASYLLTVTIETVVLLIGLTKRYSLRAKLFAGAWLTACTYPVVWLVLPPLFEERGLYLLIAETFAPIAECVLFWAAFIRPLPPNRRATLRDLGIIIGANFVSFGIGEAIYRY